MFPYLFTRIPIWSVDRVAVDVKRASTGRSPTGAGAVRSPLMELVFTGQVIEWRGPAPYYFVPVPDDESADIREVATAASYGWGVIPVEASIGGTTFTTSLFPKDGRYLLPLKAAVRSPRSLTTDDDVTVRLTVLL